MNEKGYQQAKGRKAELRVGSYLSARGRKVSLARVRQGSSAEPFDLLVDGKPIEVKTAERRESSNHIGDWVVNIHRHGVVEESGIFGYILRLEGFPGTKKKALYLFFRAPLRVATLSISIRSLLMKPKYYQAMQDFDKFAKGEL